MDAIGKLLLSAGLMLAALGGLIWAISRLGFRGLPGDIIYRSDRVTIYFPIVTMLVLSLLMTLALWLWQWVRRG